VNVAGRTVLLTGATGGLGNAIARALADRGARLLVTGQRTDALEALAGEVGGRALAADLSDPAALEGLIADVRGEPVDVLVANAGLPASGRVSDFTVEQIDRALDVNLRAPILIAQALLEGMLERGAGHLVFMSSLAGKLAPPRSSIYSATKFGLRGFAQSLREDLRGSGIGVSAIFPGPIHGAGLFAESGAELPPGTGSRKPPDVADAVLRAIEQNRAEVDVAPLPVRWGTNIGSVAPGPIAALSRRLGWEEIASKHAASDYHASRR
jgi:short-subunit dehydrogenase